MYIFLFNYISNYLSIYLKAAKLEGRALNSSENEPDSDKIEEEKEQLFESFNKLSMLVRNSK